MADKLTDFTLFETVLILRYKAMGYILNQDFENAKIFFTQALERLRDSPVEEEENVDATKSQLLQTIQEELASVENKSVKINTCAIC